MKSLIISAFLTLVLLSVPAAAGDAVKETTFTVSGLCTMCKNRIEKAMKIPEVKYAKWNKQTKQLKVAYLSESITPDSLQQRLAAAGHDTEKFKASDETYNGLPGCCKYRDGGETH